MQYFHTADEVRAAEAPLIAALPPYAAMRKAAHGLAVVVAHELRLREGGVSGRRVLLLIGSGDNGGDVLFAGAELRRRGAQVQALLLDPHRAHAAGLAAFRAAGGRVVTQVGIPHLVVDGIVGLSARGSLRPEAARVVSQIDAPVVAADLPSGVDPDTGAVDGPAVRADVTVAFGAWKPVHVLAGAWCGRLHLVDLWSADTGSGMGESTLGSFDDAEVGRLWPVPGPTDDKYSQGVTGILAGSEKYPGAGVLCTGAAVAATSGMVRYVGTGGAEVLHHYPEVVTARDLDDAGRVQAWVVGPGFGTDDDAEGRLRTVLQSDVPVLVDADGLTVLARRPDLLSGREAPTVLTPHAGEFERLTGSAPGPDRVASVRDLASRRGVTVLLKGRATVIADPDGAVTVDDAGSSWSSTAGSGDVLSGMIGALLAAGLPSRTAAALGARAHSRAALLAATDDGRRVGAPVSASPLLRALRDAVGSLRASV
ncbi:carbohydrate kinase [Rhodococcus sp. Leaf7]|uniref:NAD(P)H-hydrate dehydratase n=1 Tax=unclassified Rhodococcus (in: high G+C Gram-positive bacteria) TaxID=192944 RepID=UPI0006F9C5EB|nr:MULTISPECIES: NAD(P)H-hydrate dehydratase [unclassified Rhodococcus (in: high G+C Gram-positive bacteria)]KQU07727.1 carbohydrate kinase [Rhodococcus sp. Leaf7]KQU43245.1 carbohydrate kinase [Rhodococcus sp. Leaf247]